MSGNAAAGRKFARSPHPDPAADVSEYEAEIVAIAERLDFGGSGT